VKPWTIALVIGVALAAILFWPPFNEGMLKLFGIG